MPFRFNVLIIVLFIGLLLGFVPQTQISKIAGENTGFGRVLLVALLGAIMHIPALISFPLAASLLKSGVSITAAAAEARVNQEKAKIKKGQCLITEPATLSMETTDGAKIMGIQIERSCA